MMFEFRKLIALFLTGAWCAGLSVSTSVAQERFNPDSISQVVTIFDATVNYPPPSWQRSINIDKEHEFYRDQSGQQFLFELIPKGEKFQSWSKMLVVSGIQQSNGANMDLNGFANSQIAIFSMICSKETLSVQSLVSSPEQRRMIVYCPDSPKGPKQLGYGPGVGEIALMSFHRAGRTFIKIAHEWRGQSFDGNNQKTWPVTMQVLTNTVERFQTISVTPRQ